MNDISKETRMMVASNLTIAAAIRDAVLEMKIGPRPADSRDVVTRIYSAILADLEKDPDAAAQK